MQSGFGGVSEIQQFMVDGSPHPFFSSISSTTSPTPNSVAAAAAAAAAGHEIYHPAALPPANKLFSSFHRHPGQYSQLTPATQPPHFPHFHSNIPITQQLFTPPPPPHHHHHHHHFQLFQTNEHDHRRLLPTSPSLDHDPEQENSVSGPLLQGSGGPPPPFIPADMKFKLAVDDSSGGGGRHDFNDDRDVPGGILHGENASESRLRSWHREENCSIKEPIFWRPLDLDYINGNNKRCKDKESVELHFAKRSRVTEELENSHPGNNYKLFSELEAIYKPGGSNSAAEPANNNQTATHAVNQTTGSGSALTGDDHPLIPAVTTAAFDLDYRLEDDNSTGGEAQTNPKKAQHHSCRRRRRRRRKMKSIVAFFEGLLKQLMDHQEALHQKFLNTMEQRDKERAGLEDARREQEAARARREAVARAHDRELSAARESAILSFLEKITGETINLPPHPIVSAEKSDATAKGGDFTAPATLTTSRWPKIEVQALIQARSELDGQFQEPGLKGPLWEEVSTAMTAMGYRRSAKRCKEKWENINKYFRKSRESGRKRSQHSKTCPYFHQLDQLYSRDNGRRVKNSELLDAVVLPCAEDEVGESEGRRTAAEEAEREEDDDVSSHLVEHLQ